MAGFFIAAGFLRDCPDGTERIAKSMNHAYHAVLSPCIGICSLDDDGLCLGCRRSADEIAAWSRMNDDQRLQLMERLPSREAGVVPERA
jgi:predicted Fe-S protein YdhL (DUF1289 family)